MESGYQYHVANFHFGGRHFFRLDLYDNCSSLVHTKGVYSVSFALSRGALLDRAQV